MFNWLLKKEEKPIIVCIHGFGKRKSVEFDVLKSYLSEYECVIPDLFDQSNEEDKYMEDWIKRAEDVLLSVTRRHKRIILVGFSMGGVIASHLASKIRVERLILIAPAFEYFTFTTATSVLSDVFSKSKKKCEDSFIPLPKDFTSTFINIVDTYAQDIYRVECPLMMLHASEDEVISSNVSEKVYRKIENPHKKCFILQGGCHRLLEDQNLGYDALYLIKSYIEGKLK
ncbi:MAG: alpha/beta fold hydrolase [Erysipelotrichaceae bacterium]